MEMQALMEDVACDWRLNHAADGADAARQVMKNGLPHLVILAAQLPNVSSSDFVEWLRSFGTSSPLVVLIHGNPPSDPERDQLLRHGVEFILSGGESRELAARRLSQTIDRIEKRHLTSYSVL